MPTMRAAYTHLPRMFSLSLPLALAHVSNIAIATTDLVMNARFGTEALANSSLAFSAYLVFLIFGAGFFAIVGPLFVEEGASKKEGGLYFLWRGCWLASVLLGLFLMTLMMLPVALTHYGFSVFPHPSAGEYLAILALALWSELVFIFTAEFAASNERQTSIMYVAIASVGINAALSAIFMYGFLGVPAFGMLGSAMGTVATGAIKAIGLICLVWPRLPRRPRPAIGASLTDGWSQVKSISRLGFPSAFTEGVTIGFFSCTTFIAASLGVDQLASHAITLQLTEIAIVAALGIGEAAAICVAAVVVSQRRATVARECGYAALLLGNMLFVPFSIVFVLFGGLLVAPFIVSTDPLAATTMALSVRLLLIGAIFVPFDGCQIILLGLLRGMQDTKVPFYLCAVSYWLIGIPCCYLFGRVLEFGALGVWAGILIGLTIASLLLLHRFYAVTGRIEPVRNFAFEA